MPNDPDTVPEPERYPPPWTRSWAVKWLIVVAYTAALAALMWWLGYKEVR
jgi:hypothetical protein